MLVSRYIIWLVVYAVFGWIYESTYCTIMERRWQNRGFLYGPLCPIYGFGFIGLMATWQSVLDQGLVVAPWQVFVACALGSIVLEYVTSWGLEQLFHARWWDYSNMPLNINGRVCLPATILFGLMGLLVVYVLFEPTLAITNQLPAVAIEVLALVLVALVSADTTLTATALTQFADTASAISRTVNSKMDRFVDDAVVRSDAAAAQLREAKASAEGAITREREAFATQIRASRIGEMSAVVSSAARRIHHVVPDVSNLSSPTAQLERLLNDIRKKDESR